MAQTSSHSNGTWTAYPSLLASLPREEHRHALEEAACAHYCGRYTDAHSIFDSRLPESSTSPILALQRADLMTSQGLEHDRIKLLQSALEMVRASKENPRSIRLLMELMLADAQFWAFGEMSPAVDLLPSVRALLRASGLGNLSDVEVRRLLT